MAAPAVDRGLDQAPTSHPRLLAWVREVAELTTPDRVLWCDGFAAEWDRLTAGAGRHGCARPAQPARAAQLVLGQDRPVRRGAGRTDAPFHLLGRRGRRRAGRTNWMAPGRSEAHDDRAATGAACAGGPFTSIPLTAMGPLSRGGSRGTAWRSPTRRNVVVSMRIMAGWAPRCWRRWASSRLRTVPALRGCAAFHRVGPISPGRARRPSSSRTSGDPGDLVLRLRLRRQLVAGARSATRCGSPA